METIKASDCKTLEEYRAYQRQLIKFCIKIIEKKFNIKKKDIIILKA